MKQLLWEAYYIYITPKILSCNFEWGLSLPFDQQVTLSPKNLSPNIRYGGVTTLAQNTSSFQEVSPPRQRHLVLMRCYLLTIQVGNCNNCCEKPTIYTYLQKYLSCNFGVEVCLYLLISKWHWVQENLSPNFGCRLSLPFDQQVTLSPRNPKSQLWIGVLSLPFDQQVTLESKKPKSQH